MHIFEMPTELEENIFLHGRTVVFPKFLYQSSLIMEKRYLSM
mgnify:CR=1 FL=1